MKTGLESFGFEPIAAGRRSNSWNRPRIEINIHNGARRMTVNLNGMPELKFVEIGFHPTNKKAIVVAAAPKKTPYSHRMGAGRVVTSISLVETILNHFGIEVTPNDASVFYLRQVMHGGNGSGYFVFELDGERVELAVSKESKANK